MKKIGLCLAYKGVNYGMLLQAYATQQIFLDLGFIPEIINYKDNIKHKLSLHNIYNIYLRPIYLRSKFNKLKIKFLKKLHEEFKLTYDLRTRAADKFRRNKFVNIVTYEGYDNLKAGAFNYDAVVVGSDQQWLPLAAFGDFNTLRFVDDSIKKISFATSMGVVKYPKFVREKAKEFLSRIDFISVREESAKDIINSLINKPVKVILDPTFLLNKEDWQKRIPVQDPKKEPYILCYFLGNSKINKQKAIDLKKATGLKLISIRSTEEYSKFDTIFADEIIRNAGPVNGN